MITGLDIQIKKAPLAKSQKRLYRKWLMVVFGISTTVPNGEMHRIQMYCLQGGSLSMNR